MEGTVEEALNTAGIESLPPEVLVHLFSFVAGVEELLRAEAVCRAWHALLRSDDSAWRAVYLRTIGYPTGGGKETLRDRCVKTAKRVHQSLHCADLSPAARAIEVFRFACACGHHRLLASLLSADYSKGTDDALCPTSIESPESDLYPLHLAVMSGCKETVEQLLQAGFNANRRNATGATPLSLAAQKTLLGIVDVLLQYGADVSGQDSALLHGGAAQKGKKAKAKNAMPLLHQAAAGGYVKVVEKLLALSHNKDIDAPYGPLASTPLHLAAQHGNLATVLFLLDSGADMNVERTSSKETALFLAVKSGKAAVVRLLLERGAENKLPKGIGSAFHKACELQSSEVVEVFLASGVAFIETRDKAGRTPLLAALHSPKANRSFIEYLLSKGADITAHDSEGFDMLRTLASSAPPDQERVDLMSMLIDLHQGPLEHRTDLLEATAVHAAGYDNQGEYVRVMFDLLLSKGVKIPEEQSDIMRSAALSSLEMIQYFLDKGLRIDAHIPQEQLPILLQALYGNRPDQDLLLRNVRFILEKGADPNLEFGGDTPLFVALQYHPGLIELLVKHGADVNAKNGRGETPLFEVLTHHLYWETGPKLDQYFDVARLLLRLGADPKLCVSATGLDPYRFIHYEHADRPHIPAGWMELTAELGVPIDTVSPVPPRTPSEQEDSS